MIVEKPEHGLLCALEVGCGSLGVAADDVMLERAHLEVHRGLASGLGAAGCAQAGAGAGIAGDGAVDLHPEARECVGGRHAPAYERLVHSADVRQDLSAGRRVGIVLDGDFREQPPRSLRNCERHSRR
jgi:hypothetical protein